MNLSKVFLIFIYLNLFLYLCLFLLFHFLLVLLWLHHYLLKPILHFHHQSLKHLWYLTKLYQKVLLEYSHIHKFHHLNIHLPQCSFVHHLHHLEGLLCLIHRLEDLLCLIHQQFLYLLQQFCHLKYHLQ